MPGATPAGQDTASALVALFYAMGSTGTINAVATATSTATVTIPDPTSATYTQVTLSTSGQVPFVLPTPRQGARFNLQLVQDTTGSRTATYSTPSGSIQWVGSAAPTLTTTGGRSDIIQFECYDGTNWVGKPTLNVH